VDVEVAIAGKDVGYKAIIEVTSEDGYGEYDPTLLAKVEKNRFPKDLELQVGMKFDTEGPDGDVTVVEVVEMDEKTVTIDGNHPLAGVDLKFELEIYSVRKATAEEIEHGHAHGEDGHGHLH
jgi:FKBP-type peptidyl-prolyl cis-trans isomerase SlyD